jgi:hypothetical protein
MPRIEQVKPRRWRPLPFAAVAIMLAVALCVLMLGW